jgi:uncharacterized protein (DUF433 family)
MSEAPLRHAAVTISGVVIRETPGVSGGYPCIGNTRIPVRSIVLVHRKLGTVERTAEAFPQLTAAEVRVALDYYRAHPARVDEDVERNARAWGEITSRPWPAWVSGSTPTK